MVADIVIGFPVYASSGTAYEKRGDKIEFGLCFLHTSFGNEKIKLTVRMFVIRRKGG